MVPALSLGKFLPTGKLTPESENKYKFISINKSLTHLQEGQFDGTEQPKVSLTQFQPEIDKSEHDN